MSTWGPSAKLLPKRPCDAVIIQETHMDKTESNDVLVESDKAGYKSMVCPAGAESSRFSAKAGGVAMGVSKKWASWSLRHLASNKEDLPGKREGNNKSTAEQNQITGV
eukprot:382841-Pyramimonas_sp.AAC.1